MTARPRRGPRGRPVRPAGPTARTGDHVPVMLGQVVDLLVPALRAQGPDAVLVDGTLGLAGHAVTLLERAPDALLVGVDRDPEALALAGRRLRDRVPAPASRAVLVQDTYDRLPEALRDVGRDRADAVLLDLGVSSLQVDTAGRGFSYTLDADLDMRMDPRLPPHRRGPAGVAARARARRDAAAPGGRAGGGPHRPCRRPRTRGAAGAHDGGAGGARLRGGARRRPARTGPPGEAHLPGAARGGE